MAGGSVLESAWHFTWRYDIQCAWGELRAHPLLFQRIAFLLFFLPFFCMEHLAGLYSSFLRSGVFLHISHLTSVIHFIDTAPSWWRFDNARLSVDAGDGRSEQKWPIEATD
jgi:hypothetical protein